MKRHGAACCLTFTRVSLTETIPERLVAAVFSATTTCSVASPCPLLGLICNHALSVVASHKQSRVVLSVALRRAPDAANEPGRPFRAG